MSRAQVAELWALQQHDLELERITLEREALRRSLAADPLAPARLALMAAQNTADSRDRDLRRAESALSETRERLTRQEARLYSGGVASKDLSKAQSEIEHLRALYATQEDETLAAMVASEETRAIATTRAQALEAASATHEQESGEQQRRLRSLDTQVERAHARRGELAAACEPALLKRYEAIKRSHGGRGVAEARGGVCQGCRVTLSPSVLQRGRVATDAITCDNCGRILYFA